MFKNNAEDEADFCEAYKSQILNHDTEEKESPISSILIILFLLAMIIALSIFGYNYITKGNGTPVNTPISVQAIADEELKVTEEVVLPASTKKELDTEEIKKVVIKSFDDLPKSKSVDINDLADKIKIDMSQNEEKNDSVKESSSKEENKKIEEPLTSVTDSVKNTYIEDLAKLTEEIDKERE